MPRLSIIIPHQHSDSDLENTILSVLEHRPRDCEIIVVHNGNYADPYALGDEVLLVEETTANPVALLNAGLMLACAPVICVLANGAMVHDDAWAEDACQRLQRPSRLASLALPVQAPAGVRATYGLIASIDGCQLQAGGIDQLQPGPTAGPQLSGGFYHRRTLLSLGGWNECVAWENADVELALLMSRLELPSELSQGSAVALPKAIQRLQSHLAIKQLAELSVAYGLTPAGAGAAMSDLLRGCLSGHVSTAVAWATGVLAARSSEQIQQRLTAARQRLDRLDQQEQQRSQVAAWTVRRAA